MPGHAASSHCLPPRVSDESSGEKVRDEEEEDKKKKEKKQKKTGKEPKKTDKNKDSKVKDKKTKKEKPLFDADHEPLGGGSNDEDDGDDGDDAESEAIPRDLRPNKRPAANQPPAKKKPAGRGRGGKNRNHDDDNGDDQERMVIHSDMQYVLYLFYVVAKSNIEYLIINICLKNI